MVYVEGAVKFMLNYGWLMTTCTARSEAARPWGREDVDLENSNSDVKGNVGASTSAIAAKGTTTEGARSLEDNKSYLIWEGMLRDRAFSNFKAKSCPRIGMRMSYWVRGRKGIGVWLRIGRLKKRSCFDQYLISHH